MATEYGGRYSKPLGASRHAMGGAAEDLNIEALIGEGQFVTVFDDFNIYMDVRDLATATTGGIEDNGFTITQVGGAAAGSGVGINDDASVLYDSSLRINCGTAADEGGNIQLIPATGETHFPHIWIADSGTATSLDNTTFVFACRIGAQTDEAAGDFDGKAFIGWAAAGDTGVMTNTSGAMTVGGATELFLGFHLGCEGEVGALDGIAQGRTNTAFAEGTNFTRIGAAGYLDSTLANGADAIGDMMWFDLALRADITDMSEDTANGTVTFWHRRVLPGVVLGPWLRHGTRLDNQTPNSGTILVPTIECINGPTDESDFAVDWWMFGCSRINR